MMKISKSSVALSPKKTLPMASIWKFIGVLKVLSKTEHNAFLFFWLYKFFLCSKSLSMVNEFSYYVSTIISNRPMNLGALFLSLFYEGMKMWTDQLKTKDNKAIPGPIWFLFLWSNEYIPEFYRDNSLMVEPIRDASTYSLYCKTVSIPTFSSF